MWNWVPDAIIMRDCPYSHLIGQVVNRPQDLVRLCDNAARKGSDAAAHPTDCER